jgi:pilus assembly protein CpaF
MIPIDAHDRLLRQLLDPVVGLLDDPTVSEVLVNGPSVVWVERGGKLMRTEARFESAEALMSALRALAQFVGRPLDAERPVLEGRMPDGSRVEAIVPPAALDGPAVAIRRFAKSTLTMQRLVELGAVPDEAAQVLSTLVRGKRNVVVAGGTGSGKTSLLNALSGCVDEGERIVVIEDAAELQLQHGHVVRLEAKPADERGCGRVTVGELFRATLRMRPDRIVVGEIRGPEAFELVQAMTSGHGGCLTTVHASHARDAVGRLESLALGAGVDLPHATLRAQLASAIDFVVHTGRLADGSRRVTQISEVVGFDPTDGYRVVDIYALGPTRQGTGAWELAHTGARLSTTRWADAAGLKLPRRLRLDEGDMS